MNVSKLKKQLLCLSCLLLLSFQSFADTFSSELLTDRVNVYWNTSMQVTFRYRISEGIWQEISYEYDDNNKPNGKTIGEGDGLAPGTRIDIKLSSTNIWIRDYERTYYVATTPSHAYASIHDDRIVVQWDEHRFGNAPLDIRFKHSNDNSWTNILNQASGHIDLTPGNGFSTGNVEVEYKFTNANWSGNPSNQLIKDSYKVVSISSIEDEIKFTWPNNRYGGNLTFDFKYKYQGTSDASSYLYQQSSGNVTLRPNNGFIPQNVDVSIKESSSTTWNTQVHEFNNLNMSFVKTQIYEGYNIKAEWLLGKYGNTAIKFRYRDYGSSTWTYSENNSTGRVILGPLSPGLKEIEIAFQNKDFNNHIVEHRIEEYDIDFQSVVVVDDYVNVIWDKDYYKNVPIDIRYEYAIPGRGYPDGPFKWKYIDNQTSGNTQIRREPNGFDPKMYLWVQVKFSTSDQWPSESTTEPGSTKFVEIGSTPNHVSFEVSDNNTIIASWPTDKYGGQDLYFHYKGEGDFWTQNFIPSTEEQRIGRAEFAPPGGFANGSTVSGTVTFLDWTGCYECEEKSFSLTIPTSSSYRLKEIEFQPQIISDSFNIYPNPLVDQSTLEFNLGDQLEYEIKVYDLTGSVVHSKKGIGQNGINKLKIDKSDFSSKGIHIIELVSDKQIRRKKVIN
ncbi:T9SS type A sorting domain-containing protein [Flammeovirga pectinis]|uniref:T9SS type A sorting domain-containing protein n=1 Tax=Flammeovirga pectinis TaxID=2494373 RepID=A0A3Q9FP15_9BACT|nr:T9SS type A sorting domain-containing protein [Flammeovirga pectinis]AZQ61402.1 T9SS type A sorting domain-containing protein [Flammeovirga pectinis]